MRINGILNGKIKGLIEKTRQFHVLSSMLLFSLRYFLSSGSDIFKLLICSPFTRGIYFSGVTPAVETQGDLEPEKATRAPSTAFFGPNETISSRFGPCLTLLGSTTAQILQFSSSKAVYVYDLHPPLTTFYFQEEEYLRNPTVHVQCFYC